MNKVDRKNETTYWDKLYYEKVLKYYKENKSGKDNIHHPDWWRVWATKKDIENMTLEQAVEIVERVIIEGHTSNSLGPREHYVKALEILIDKAKKYDELTKENIEYE